MGRAERLVQIDMHRIDAKVAGAHPADNRVEIRPVAVNITARRVHRVRNFLQVALEQAAGIGVGNHHARNIGAQPGFERCGIDATLGGGGNILHRKAGKGRRCRVSAVRGFGNENDLAIPLAARLKGCLDAQNAAQLPMRARLGTHRNAVHPGQLDEPHRQLVDDAQRALYTVHRLERVDVGKTGQPRHLFVEPRIMLHRARAEREKAEVNAVILAAQARVVAHRLRLRQARQANRAYPFQPAEAAGRGGYVGNVDASGVAVANLKDQRFLKHQSLVAGVGCGACCVTCAAHFGAPSACVNRHASTS